MSGTPGGAFADCLGLNSDSERYELSEGLGDGNESVSSDSSCF